MSSKRKETRTEASELNIDNELFFPFRPKSKLLFGLLWAKSSRSFCGVAAAAAAASRFDRRFVASKSAPKRNADRSPFRPDFLATLIGDQSGDCNAHEFCFLSAR